VLHTDKDGAPLQKDLMLAVTSPGGVGEVTARGMQNEFGEWQNALQAIFRQTGEMQSATI
jgi:hypothetical protein